MLAEIRQNKILNSLSLHTNILDKDLKKYVGCALPTMKKDIVDINNQLEGIARIHLKNQYYSLEILDQKEFEKAIVGGLKKNLDFNSSQKRIAYMLSCLLKNETFIKIDELSNKMNISRSTLNNDIKKAKKDLKKYNVTIKGMTNKGISLEGEEFNLRLVMLYFVFDYYNIYIYFSHKISNLIEELCEFYQLNFQYRNMLYKMTSISITRILEGHRLKKPIVLYQDYQNDNLILNQFFHLLEEEFSISLSSIERGFLSFPINIRNSYSIKEVNNSKYEREIREIFEEMASKIEKTYFIKINQNEFFEKIKNHLMALINRLVFRFPLDDIFSKQMKENFPLAFELAKVSVEVLQQKYHLYIDETEISYLAIYFVLFLEEKQKNNQLKDERIKKILVISNVGIGAFELFKRQIKYILGNNTLIYHVNEFDYVDLNIETYDMVFALGPMKLNKNIPLIKIPNIFDRDYIEREIEKNQRRNYPITFKDLNQSMEISLFHLPRDYDYYSGVSYMIHMLIQENQLDAGFYERWKKREAIQEMTFDNGIAIPHAENKDYKKFILSVGIYSSKIKQKDKLVKVVFLIGVSEEIDSENEKMLTFIYDKIFSIAVDERLYKEMVNVKNVEEIKTLLLRKE